MTTTAEIKLKNNPRRKCQICFGYFILKDPFNTWTSTCEECFLKGAGFPKLNNLGQLPYDE